MSAPLTAALLLCMVSFPPAAGATVAPQCNAGLFYGSLPISGDVPRVQWDLNDPDFASKVIAAATPVILENTPPTLQWPAFTDRPWSTDYIRSKLGGQVVNVAAPTASTLVDVPGVGASPPRRRSCR